MSASHNFCEKTFYKGNKGFLGQCGSGWGRGWNTRPTCQATRSVCVCHFIPPNHWGTCFCLHFKGEKLDPQVGLGYLAITWETL